jgi:membrane associated rhomboid family serine protease
MLAVFVTALVTWVVMVVLGVVNLFGFFVDGTIAVLGGFAAGMLVPWFLARRARARR